MKTFFPNIHSLHRYTLELDTHQELRQCRHCAKHGQFVSHGFVRKQLSANRRKIVAKRIFCSNRSGRKGCGRTQQLYLAHAIPRLRYSANALLVFIAWLLAGFSVTAAYCRSTLKADPSHGYRWIKKLLRQLSHYRVALSRPPDKIDHTYPQQNRSLQLLLPTLKSLFQQLPGQPCCTYQRTLQIAFI